MVFLLICEGSLFNRDINHSSMVIIEYSLASSQSLTCTSAGFIMVSDAQKFTLDAVKL